MKDTDAIDRERQRRGAELAAELRDAISFPPLPPSPAEVGDLILQTREHVQSLGWGNREQLYTASQVRELMSECAIMSAARERQRRTVTLPLLPKAEVNVQALLSQPIMTAYSAGQMRDYAIAALRAAGVEVSKT